MVRTPHKSDIDILREIGALSFGPRWQRPLAAELKISHVTISMILHNKMQMSPALKAKLIAYLARLEKEFELKALGARAIVAQWAMQDATTA